MDKDIKRLKKIQDYYAQYRIILEKAVGRTHIAQVLDSLDYMKKVLIPHAWDFVTNKVTTHFFITPFKSIAYTLHALPTVFSRIIPSYARIGEMAGIKSKNGEASVLQQ